MIYLHDPDLPTNVQLPEQHSRPPVHATPEALHGPSDGRIVASYDGEGVATLHDPELQLPEQHSELLEQVAPNALQGFVGDSVNKAKAGLFVIVGPCDGEAEGVCNSGRLHACASRESRKISVGVVMIFPIQKTHVSEDIDAKASEPTEVTVDGIVTVATSVPRNIELPTVERPLIRDIRVREAQNTNAKSPIEVTVDGIVTVTTPELWNMP